MFFVVIFIIIIIIIVVVVGVGVGVGVGGGSGGVGGVRTELQRLQLGRLRARAIQRPATFGRT